MPKDGQPARSPKRHRRQERQASAHPAPARRGPSRLARERAALGLLGEAGHCRDAPGTLRAEQGGPPSSEGRRAPCGRDGERPRPPLPARLRSKGTEAANRRPLRCSRPPNHPIAALRLAEIPPRAPPKDKKGSPGFAPPRPAGSSRPRSEMPKPLPGSDREGGHAGRQERAATGAEERHGSGAGDVILRTSCFPESEGAGLDLLWAEVSQSPFQDAARRFAHAQLIGLPLRVGAAAAAGGPSFHR